MDGEKLSFLALIGRLSEQNSSVHKAREELHPHYLATEEEGYSKVPCNGDTVFYNKCIRLSTKLRHC